MTELVIALGGAALGIAVGFVEHSPLLGAVVFLSVAVVLLLIAGTRVERELRGDFGIRLEKVADVEWVKLAITNDSGAWARFRADVTAIDPPPDGSQESTWAISWPQTRGREESIEPHGTQYLYFCQAEIMPPIPVGPPSIRKPTASIAFKTVAGMIYYAYDNADKARSPITVSVRVSRLGSHAKAEETFKVWLEYDNQDHSERFRVVPTSQLPPTPSVP